MEGTLTVLAHKEQAALGTVLPAGVAAARAGLTGVVGIHADAATACQGRFVGEQSAEFGKRPLRGMPIRLAGSGGNRDQLLALATPLATFRPLADASQIFQADETVRMGVQDLPGDGVVGAQLEPSRLPAPWRSVAGSRCECLCAGAVVGHARSGQLWLLPAFLCKTGCGSLVW